MNGNKAGGDLVLIWTSLLFSCKLCCPYAIKLLNIYMRKTKRFVSKPASLSLKGQVNEQQLENGLLSYHSVAVPSHCKYWHMCQRFLFCWPLFHGFPTSQYHTTHPLFLYTTSHHLTIVYHFFTSLHAYCTAKPLFYDTTLYCITQQLFHYIIL